MYRRTRPRRLLCPPSPASRRHDVRSRVPVPPTTAPKTTRCSGTYRTTGDRQVRNQLIDRHRWLAIHCAKRFADKGEPLDDLVQVGMLGVLKAVERFDPDYGAAFATFAVPTIVGELRRHFRDTTWAVHVPRRAKDLQHTIKVAVDELGQILGRSPTVTEIAGHAGVRDEDVLDAIEAGRCYRKTPLETASDDATGASRRHRRTGRGRPWPRRRRGRVDGRPAADRPSAPRTTHRRAALRAGLHAVADRRAGRRQPGPGVPPPAVEPGRHA